MKKVFIAIGILFVLVVGWLIISRTGGHQSMSPADQTTAGRVPDFNLQDYNGKTIHLADFRGKPIVINSWAAWCPFCGKELVDFAATQKEFGNKVAIVAIDRAETREVAKKYTDELGVTEAMVFLLDPSDSFYQAIGGFSMPETVFVNKSGEIIIHKRGPMEVSEIKEKVKKLLAI